MNNTNRTSDISYLNNGKNRRFCHRAPQKNT